MIGLRVISVLLDRHTGSRIMVADPQLADPYESLEGHSELPAGWLGNFVDGDGQPIDPHSSPIQFDPDAPRRGVLPLWLNENFQYHCAIYSYIYK